MDNIIDELFCCTDYTLTLEAQLQSLEDRKKEFLANGDTAAASEVDAEISEKKALLARVQHKDQGLLDILAPFAQINVRHNVDASLQETLKAWNDVHTFVGWLGDLELEPDEDAPWITTCLKWFLDSGPDYEPWLHWVFSD